MTSAKKRGLSRQPVGSPGKIVSKGKMEASPAPQKLLSQEEAEKIGEGSNPDDAREIVYGMPYQKWKELYQKPASQEQLDLMNARKEK